MKTLPNTPQPANAANPPRVVDPDIRIAVLDEVGAGGAHHEYRLDVLGGALETYAADGTATTTRRPLVSQSLKFQKGGKRDVGVNGITQEALLEVVRHRLECFQAGPFPSPENASALLHVEKAIAMLARRTAKRTRRGVEGKSVP